jgi:hypothetical protein
LPVSQIFYCVKELIMRRFIWRLAGVLPVLMLLASCYGGVAGPDGDANAGGTLVQSYRSGSFSIEVQWDSTLVVTPEVKVAGDSAIWWWTDVLAENDLPSLDNVPSWRFRQCGVDLPTDRNVGMVIRLESSRRIKYPSAVVSCRRTAGLPFTGVIRLPREAFIDSVAHEPTAGFVNFAIRHEMAHVLGIGYWNDREAEVVGVNGSVAVGGGAYFAGDSATAVYRTLTGKKALYGVPLDYNRVRVDDWHNRAVWSDHWRFSSLPEDVMIPYYLPRKKQVVSAVTLAALVDLGWQVNMSMAEPLIRGIR